MSMKCLVSVLSIQDNVPVKAGIQEYTCSALFLANIVPLKHICTVLVVLA